MNAIRRMASCSIEWVGTARAAAALAALLLLGDIMGGCQTAI